MDDLKDAASQDDLDRQPDAAANTAPAARRRPMWLWPAVGLVSIALAAGGYFAYSTVRANDLARERAGAAQDAEKHWEAISRSFASLENIDKGLRDIEADSAQASLTTWSDSLTRMEAEAAPEIAEAEKAVALLPESVARTAYTTALTDAKTALKKAVGAKDALGKLPAFYEKSSIVHDALQDARSNINDAVDSGNRRKHDASIRYAKLALAELAKGDKAIAEMRALVTSDVSLGDAGLDDAVTLVKAERSLANLQLEITRWAKAGNYTKANAAIKRYNKALSGINDYDSPEFLDNPSRFAATASNDLQAGAALWNAAKMARERALKASIGAGK